MQNTLTYTRRSSVTRYSETVTPVEASEVADCLHRCAWSVADAPSDMFQRRWNRTDGGILKIPGYHNFTLVVFMGRERIEFNGPDGARIRLFADQEAFPYPWGMGAWIDETRNAEQLVGVAP